MSWEGTTPGDEVGTVLDANGEGRVQYLSPLTQRRGKRRIPILAIVLE